MHDFCQRCCSLGLFSYVILVYAPGRCSGSPQCFQAGHLELDRKDTSVSLPMCMHVNCSPASGDSNLIAHR